MNGYLEVEETRIVGHKPCEKIQIQDQCEGRRAKANTEPTVNSDEGRYQVRLNGIESVALGDSGAYYSNISSNLLQAILSSPTEV